MDLTPVGFDFGMIVAVTVLHVKAQTPLLAIGSELGPLVVQKDRKGYAKNCESPAKFFDNGWVAAANLLFAVVRLGGDCCVSGGNGRLCCAVRLYHKARVGRGCLQDAACLGHDLATLMIAIYLHGFGRRR